MVSFHIAKAEWRKLFFSPIAWLLLIVFVVQSGSTLIGTFSGYGVGMETGYSLSENILRWLLRNIQDYIYLYVPLLTMGLMSEELSTKTINLLYSSPIANRQIVMGKYLAMMGYGLLLCAVLLVDVVLVACGVPHFEWGVGLVGVLGVYLLFCTYASIGLFMSSLISYQLIAAIGTFAVFAILDIVGPFGRDIPILRDVTYWLDISSRASDFSSGLLTTEGVLYYVVMSGLFIVLTIFRLNAVRQKIPFAHVVWKNLAAIVVACLIGYFSAQPGWIGYWDTTTRKINTLHPVGQEVLANIPENATMTYYANVLYYYDWSALRPSQILNDKYRNYSRILRFKPNIKFEYVGFYDNILNGRQAYPPQPLDTLKKKVSRIKYIDKDDLLSPSQIREVIDMTPVENRSARLIALPDGRNSWLRRETWESTIITAFKQLIVPSPVIGFATESRMFSRMRDGFREAFTEVEEDASFINSGFDFCLLSLSNPVADSVSILVLADLPAALTEEQDRHLQEFIDRGGDLMVLAEPRNREVMDPLLRKFGFEMGEGILTQERDEYGEISITDVVSTYFTPEALTLSPFFGFQDYGPNPEVWVGGCAPLVSLGDSSFNVTPILRTAPSGTWNELQQEYITEEYDITYDPETGEREEAFVTAVALSREINGKTQKILLSGDADILSNISQGWVTSIRGNFLFRNGITHWLSDGEYPLIMRYPAPTDDVFDYSKETVKTLDTIFVYVLPGVLVMAFLLLWFRRKSR